jgi:hypothetical protein
MVFRVHAEAPPDTARLAPGIFSVPIDIPRTDSLAWGVYRYGELLEADSVQLDPTNRNIAINLSYPLYGLGLAYALEGDSAAARRNLESAVRLYYLPELARTLQAGEGLLTQPLEGDTPIAP